MSLILVFEFLLVMADRLTTTDLNTLVDKRRTWLTYTRLYFTVTFVYKLLVVKLFQVMDVPRPRKWSLV